MSNDRLQELLVASKSSSSSSSSVSSYFTRKLTAPASPAPPAPSGLPPSPAPGTSILLAANLDALISTLDACTAILKQLKGQYHRATGDTQKTHVMQEMKRCTGEAQGATAGAVSLLGRRGEFKEGLSSIPGNLHQHYTQKLEKSLGAYRTALTELQTEVTERQKRELGLLDDTLSPSEISRIVEEGHAQELVSQTVLSDARTRDLVDQIGVRHSDILYLERQMVELMELFKSLQTLVDVQGESLNIIENHVEHSKDYVERGEVNLQEAADYQGKTRWRYCCCLGILGVILVVILVPTLMAARS